MSTTGFQIYQGASYRQRADSVFDTRPVLADYGLRRRADGLVAVLARGVSRTSAYFDLMHSNVLEFSVPEAVDQDPAIEQLMKLMLLPSNWDGRGAPAPTRSAATIAHVAVEAGRSVGLQDIRVSPDVEGGIATYFFGGPKMADGGWSRQAGILADNDGEAVLYMRDRGQKGADVEEIESGAEDIRAVVNRILKFIAGA